MSTVEMLVVGAKVELLVRILKESSSREAKDLAKKELIRRGLVLSSKVRGRLCFEDWMELVDRQVSATMGVSVYDLPDCAFRTWYDDGMSVTKAAAKVIRNASEF